MENNETSCARCGDILAAYRRSVRDFTKFIRGVLKSDLQVATNEAQDLSQQCKNGSDTLMADWRQDHNNRAAKWALHEPARVTMFGDTHHGMQKM